MNYAAVRSFPLFPSLTRGPSLSAAEAQAGVQRGPCRILGHASTCSRAAVPSGRPNSGRDLFSYLFCFIISQICVDIQKYVSPSW